MTNSISSISRSSRLLIVVATLLLWVGGAHAGRKRIVVLEFEGPKAEKFHEDVVKLLKKNHTVISVDKWNDAAEELDAGKVTEKNVKKIAKKLKVDGVITGKIEKRRDEYIIRLKLRAGTTGELSGSSVQTKADGPRLDGQAQRDIKEELIGAIDELESNRGGGGDDEEDDRPAKKKKSFDDEEEEDTPKKSGFSRKNDEEEEDKPVKKTKKEEAEERKAAKKAEEEEAKAAKEEAKAAKKKKKSSDDEEEALSTKKSSDDEEEEETPKSKKRSKSADDEEEDEDGGEKKVADGDEEESVEEEAAEPTDTELNLSPAHRAVDAVVGLSFTRRNLNFTTVGNLANTPPGYKQKLPVAGAIVDVTAYPMAFGHKNKGILNGLGISVLYDRVLFISSQKKFANAGGMQEVATLKTQESRWAVGAVFRYPLGSGARAPVVGGRLTYGRQRFAVEQTLPGVTPTEPTDIPNVEYSMISPAAFVHFPVTNKIVANLEATFHGILDAGAIQTPQQYGAATILGYGFAVGGEYMLLKSVFVRAEFRYQAFNLKFKGDAMSKTHLRDTDPANQEVTAAKDGYMGGAATVGYVF